MKLIIAIVHELDSKEMEKALIENDIRLTKLASKGGFLREGQETYLIGVEDTEVDAVISLIKETASQREEVMFTMPHNYDINLGMNFSHPQKVNAGGATVFVLDLEQFHKL